MHGVNHAKIKVSTKVFKRMSDVSMQYQCVVYKKFRLVLDTFQEICTYNFMQCSPTFGNNRKSAKIPSQNPRTLNFLSDLITYSKLRNIFIVFHLLAAFVYYFIFHISYFIFHI